jgi:hypothetical protein
MNDVLDEHHSPHIRSSYRSLNSKIKKTGPGDGAHRKATGRFVRGLAQWRRGRRKRENKAEKAYSTTATTDRNIQPAGTTIIRGSRKRTLGYAVTPQSPAGRPGYSLGAPQSLIAELQEHKASTAGHSLGMNVAGLQGEAAEMLGGFRIGRDQVATKNYPRGAILLIQNKWGLILRYCFYGPCTEVFNCALGSHTYPHCHCVLPIFTSA